MQKTGLIQRLELEREQSPLRRPIKKDYTISGDIDDYIFGEHDQKSEK